MCCSHQSFNLDSTFKLFFKLLNCHPELGEKAKETERLNAVDSELKSMKEGKDKADGTVLELKRNVEVTYHDN